MSRNRSDLGELDDLVELAADLRRAHAEDGAVEEDVLAAGQLGVEAGADLEQRADAAADADPARVGSVMRERILSSVVLPAPFRPMMPSTSPASTRTRHRERPELVRRVRRVAFRRSRRTQRRRGAARRSRRERRRDDVRLARHVDLVALRGVLPTDDRRRHGSDHVREARLGPAEVDKRRVRTA